MIKIVIDDIRNINPQEAIALSHMFMNLAGHSLHAVENTCPIPPVVHDKNIENDEELIAPIEEIPKFQELDSNGIPWDIRIHARNKSKTPNGVWKLGRNIAPDFVKKVTTELKDIFPVTAIMPPLPIEPPLPIAPPPPPSAPPAMSASELYETLLNKVTTGMGDGTLTIVTINNVLKSFKDPSGVTIAANLAVLGTLSDIDKQELIPKILRELA